MKLIKVRCPGGLKVEAEDLGTGAVKCPPNCPKKKSSACFKNTFRYAFVLNASVTPDVPYIAEAAAPASAPAASTPASAPAATPARPATSRPATSRPATSRPATSRPATSRPATPAQTPKREEPSVIPMADPFAAPVEEPSVIPMADPFAPVAVEEPSVIPMADPFATPAAPVTPASPRVETPTRSARSTLDKYNAVADSDSLFARVRTREEGEPCFVDGGYAYYEGRAGGRQSQGNANAALRHIFRHWYTHRVFSDDGKSFREDFLYLLKIRGFANKEKELRELVEDATLSINRKFFRLFYNIVYKNSISGFYFSEESSPFRLIEPRFVDPTDFYTKIAELSDPSAFLDAYEDCFEELVFFLRAGASDAREPRDWFFDEFPLTMAEHTGCVYTLAEKGAHIRIGSLGRVRDFVAQFAEPASLAEMEERVRFFSRFRISVNRAILPRSEPIVQSRAVIREDDDVYVRTGIAALAASQSATAYNYYITLLSEYVETFHPDRITVGGMTFTRRNFYREVVDAVVAACAYLAEDDGRRHEEILRLHLVRSLFSRGIFRDFEKDCEASSLASLRRAFLEKEELDISTYFCFDIRHEVVVDGRRTDMDGYISSLAENGLHHLLGIAKTGDTVLNAYFAARIAEEEQRRAAREIDDLVRRYDSMLKTLNTI